MIYRQVFRMHEYLHNYFDKTLNINKQNKCVQLIYGYMITMCINNNNNKCM